MSFQTTMERLYRAARQHVRGEAPDTCRVQREDLRSVLALIERLDAGARTGVPMGDALDPNLRPDLHFILGVLHQLAKTTSTHAGVTAALHAMRYIVKRTDEAVASPAPASIDVPFLTEADLQSLRRFIKTTEDDGSYDIAKEALKRLTQLGAVCNIGFGYYSVTAFGCWAGERHWDKRSAPLAGEVHNSDSRYAMKSGTCDAGSEASAAVRLNADIVRLAQEGVRVNKPGAPEHSVCAELVRLAAALSAQPGAQEGQTC